jgi:hypothetical protein
MRGRIGNKHYRKIKYRDVIKGKGVQECPKTYIEKIQIRRDEQIDEERRNVFKQAKGNLRKKWRTIIVIE